MEPPELLLDETGSDLALVQETREPGVLARLSGDYAFQALVVTILLVNFGLIGFLIVRYDALPDPLPLHYDASGLPDRIDARSGIIMLPAIGFFVLAVNFVLGILAYRRDRVATLVLLVGALFVQVLMWLAMVNAAGGLY